MHIGAQNLSKNPKRIYTIIQNIRVGFPIRGFNQGFQLGVLIRGSN